MLNYALLSMERLAMEGANMFASLFFWDMSLPVGLTFFFFLICYIWIIIKLIYHILIIIKILLIVIFNSNKK